MIVSIGEPLARVDKRKIVTRLKTFLWVKDVSVSRNIISRVVSIKVVPRTPLARIEDPTNPSQKRYLADDLSLFSVTDSATNSLNGTTGAQLPILTLATPDRAALADVKILVEKLREKSLAPVTIRAIDRAQLASTLVINGRKVDVSWGSVKDLPLKIEIANKLMSLPENLKIKSIDVTEPTSPIVR
jgi:cell division septal protein FtsQ